MKNAGLDEPQAGIKIAGRNTNNLRYADDSTLMAESEEVVKILLMKWEESEKAGLKLNIQKTKIMASGPITSWQIDWEKTETVTDFIFLGSKITADGDCSHEIKRCLLLERKTMTNLDSILKSRDITLLTKVCLVSQSYSFSSSHVWMWELDHKERWVPNYWCFGMRCQRRLLRVPWTARKSNQSILKEISPEYSLERLTLKLKFQYFGPLMQRLNYWKKPWCWERLKVGVEGDDRGWDAWMASPTRWTWVWVSSRSWWWTGKPGMLQFMESQRVRHDWPTELNWYDTINVSI